MELAHRFVDSLKADPETRNYCRQVRNAHYSWVEPPRLRANSHRFFCKRCGIARYRSRLVFDARGCIVLAGNRLLPGSKPYAMCYGGHQLEAGQGNWEMDGYQLGREVAPDGLVVDAATEGFRQKLPTLVRETVWRSCVLRFVNTFAVRQCTIWVCLRLGL